MFKAIYDKSEEKVTEIWLNEDALTELVFGLASYSILWADVDYVYSTINIEHWILLVFDINLGEVILYNSYLTYVSQKDILIALLPLIYTLSSLCDFYKMRDRKPHIVAAPWSLYRTDTGNIQGSKTLNCSIFFS